MAGYLLAKPVYFIGFMGSGKSSVSRYLGKAEGLDVADIDEMVEEAQGKSISQIFEEDGEEAFRELEAAQLAAVSQGAPKLVACGGGIVGREENTQLMDEAGFIVWLEVSAEEAQMRIGDDENRPLFTDMESVRQLLWDREELYDRASDAAVDTTGRDIAEIAAEVRDLLIEAEVLVQA